MRTVIIFSLFVQFGFSQQQQQFLANNISNFNNQNDNNRGNINFSNVIQSSNSQVSSNKPKQINRPTVRVRPASITNQINTISANKTPITAQVIRSRPRTRQNIQPTRVNQPIINVVTQNNSNASNSASGNESNPISQMNNFVNNTDLQIQSVSNDGNSFPQQEQTNSGNQTSFNLDLSLNLSGHSIIKAKSYSSGTSSHVKNRMFAKKVAKFKRNFFGKLSSHKKSKHLLDVCFAWKN
ncbi:MAG: hypothetical protein Q7W45_17080 [Bacteroidota bacterium]|nr:hypothetical protein [Bacteroidota bacterium]MDP3145271.1 hypothetical protein [Bacteroidota bacterium]MDP3556900.1 hypothetical protein [Bacteroidota bacterium]